MKNLRKIVSMLLCACMLLGMTALAEETVAPASDAVVATVNGQDVTWGQVETAYNALSAQYSSYYDMTLPETIELFRAVAMENTITEVLLEQKAVEFGLAELTAEEIAELDAAAAEDWEHAIQNYLSYYYPDMTAETPAEEQEAARAEAEKYYADNGYTPESHRAGYHRNGVLFKVQSMMVQDAVVTDEDVEALYQSLLAADKEMYENDIAAYVEYNNQVDMMAMYAAMYGMPNEMDYAWYKPEGFRAVKHILLPVDEELMATYTDLQARYEEQQSGETAEAAEGEEAAEEPAEPVTAEQINAAKAAILVSLADTIEEINTKIADGADFDALIAEYGSDPGMTAEPYMTTGYEVCAASSNYVPEFVEASMSIEEVGGVSAPYLSSYGIHIVKYIGDVAGGPIEMTAEQREAKRVSLLTAKQNELYAATLEGWLAESAIAYTGVITSMDELEAAQ